jgi:hypothetical protein
MQSKMVVMSILSSIALSACSVVGIRSSTEEPRYTVLQVQGPLEIRTYGARLAAETEVTGTEESSRSDGFRRLARYIFGANSSKGGIAMTAPVAQAGGSHTIAMTVPLGQDRSAPDVWRIRFFMPAQYTEATLPRPDDPLVKIVIVPAETYGVYRYSGSTDPTATEAADHALLQRLEGSGWVPAGPPVAWFYDPPWTLPFLRRNEAAVKVARAPG